MPRLLLLLFLFFYHPIPAQTLIHGKILYMGKNLEGVHIVNSNTRSGTISDVKGEFSMHVNLGDVLAFSTLSHEINQITVDTDLLSTKRLVVEAKLNVVQLDEVILNDGYTGNFGDINLYEFEDDEKTRAMNPNDRGKLHNGANLIEIGSMISKAIFGSKKKEKPTPFLDRPKFSRLLLQKYEEDFIQENFNIPKDSIIGFLFFCDEQVYPDDIFRKEKEFYLIDFLHTASKNYRNVMKK